MYSTLLLQLGVLFVQTFASLVDHEVQQVHSPYVAMKDPGKFMHERVQQFEPIMQTESFQDLSITQQGTEDCISCRDTFSTNKYSSNNKFYEGLMPIRVPQVSSSRQEFQHEQRFVDGKQIYDFRHEKKYKDGQLIHEETNKKDLEDLAKPNFDSPKKYSINENQEKSSLNFESSPAFSRNGNLNEEVENIKQQFLNPDFPPKYHIGSQKSETTTQVRYINGQPFYLRNEQKKYKDGRLIHNSTIEKGEKNFNFKMPSMYQSNPHFENFNNQEMSNLPHSTGTSNSQSHYIQPHFVASESQIQGSYASDLYPSNNLSKILDIHNDYRKEPTPINWFTKINKNNNDLSISEPSLSSNVYSAQQQHTNDHQNSPDSGSFRSNNVANHNLENVSSRHAIYNNQPHLTHNYKTINFNEKNLESEQVKSNLYHQPKITSTYNQFSSGQTSSTSNVVNNERLSDQKPFTSSTSNVNNERLSDQKPFTKAKEWDEVHTHNLKLKKGDIAYVGKNIINERQVPFLKDSTDNISNRNYGPGNNPVLDNKRYDISPLDDEENNRHNKNSHLLHNQPQTVNVDNSKDFHRHYLSNTHHQTHAHAHYPYQQERKDLQGSTLHAEPSSNAHHISGYQYSNISHMGSIPTFPISHIHSQKANITATTSTTSQLLPFISRKHTEIRTKRKYINEKMVSETKFYKYYVNGNLVHQNQTEKSREDLIAEGTDVTKYDLKPEDLSRYRTTFGQPLQQSNENSDFHYSQNKATFGITNNTLPVSNNHNTYMQESKKGNFNFNQKSAYPETTRVNYIPNPSKKFYSQGLTHTSSGQLVGTQNYVPQTSYYPHQSTYPTGTQIEHSNQHKIYSQTLHNITFPDISHVHNPDYMHNSYSTFSNTPAYSSNSQISQNVQSSANIPYASTNSHLQNIQSQYSLRNSGNYVNSAPIRSTLLPSETKQTIVNEQKEFVNGNQIYDLHHEQRFLNNKMTYENKTEKGPEDFVGKHHSQDTFKNILLKKQSNSLPNVQTVQQSALHAANLGDFKTHSSVEQQLQTSFSNYPSFSRYGCATCTIGSHSNIPSHQAMQHQVKSNVAALPSFVAPSHKSYSENSEFKIEEAYKNGELLHGRKEESKWKNGELLHHENKTYSGVSQLPSSSHFTSMAFNGDNCEGSACHNGGSCIGSTVSSVCICNYGFRGSDCGEAFCPSRYCHHRGRCLIQNNQHSCQCPSGFSGSRCSIRITFRG